MLDVYMKMTLPNFDLDVSFNSKGEVLCLVGPSGAGKSLTLQCISGLLTPQQGLIKLNDRVLFDSDKGINVPIQDRRIGYVFQNYALFPHMTVFENIAFGLRDLKAQERKARVDKILQMTDLQGYADFYPAQLSGGQQQRVALARSIVYEPELLLLDEPLSALDSHLRHGLEREILSLHEYYRGDIIHVTHDLQEAFRLGSSMAVFDKGRIIQIGQKDDIINRPINSRAAYLTGFRNIMEGYVDEITPSHIAVTVPSVGRSLRVKAVRVTEYVKGMSVRLGIRSENIRISSMIPQGPGENAIPVVLTELVEGITEFTCTYRAAVSMPGEVLIQAVISHRDFIPGSMGDKYYAILPSEKLFLSAS